MTKPGPNHHPHSATPNPNRSRFCRALALADVVAKEAFYMRDNEYAQELSALVKELAKYFKNTLLPKDDEVLGIDRPKVEDGEDGEAPPNVVVNGREISDSRAALYRKLDMLTPEIEGMCCIPTKFNWKVGKPRKQSKKAAEADAEIDADADAAAGESDEMAIEVSDDGEEEGEEEEGHDRFMGGARAGQCKVKCAKCKAKAKGKGKRMALADVDGNGGTAKRTAVQA